MRLDDKVHEVKITEQVISAIRPVPAQFAGAFDRLSSSMDAGDDARRLSDVNGVLAKGAIGVINTWRRRETPEGVPERRPRVAHVISALKHPDEVEQLRATHSHGFYLIGVHADEARRREFLVKSAGQGMSDEETTRLMDRDRGEQLDWGQRVAVVFHLADLRLQMLPMSYLELEQAAAVEFEDAAAALGKREER